MSEAEMRFDTLEPIEVPVTIGTDKDVDKYVLREADEQTASAYRNSQMQGAQMKGGVISFAGSNAASSQSLLLAGCLYYADEEGNRTNRLVPRATIKQWPARIVKPLFETARRISDLQEQAPEQQLLAQALRLDGSPVSLEALKTWLEELADETYEPLLAWVNDAAESSEERAKNLPTGTTDGSG